MEKEGNKMTHEMTTLKKQNVGIAHLETGIKNTLAKASPVKKEKTKIIKI